jgi:hypothetical protein
MDWVIHRLILKYKKMMNLFYLKYLFQFCFRLGFDPCSLYLSALAPDIEDERRPLPTQNNLLYRPTTNSYDFPSQYTSTSNNQPIGQINPSWMMQPQQQPPPPPQQQQHYHQYHEQQPTTPQKQQRYPLPFSKYLSILKE